MDVDSLAWGAIELKGQAVCSAAFAPARSIWSGTRRKPGTFQPLINLASVAFPHGARIPLRHAGERAGQNISPPLSWPNIPQATVELSLLMEDPDVPLPSPDHPSDRNRSSGRSDRISRTVRWAAGTAPNGVQLWPGALGHIGYAGPRPLVGHGPHKYFFRLLALDRHLTLAKAPSRAAIC